MFAILMSVVGTVGGYFTGGLSWLVTALVESPMWLKLALVGAIIFGSTIGYYKIQVHNRDNQIVSITEERDNATKQVGALQSSLASLEENNKQLKQTVANQNQAILDLQKNAQKASETTNKAIAQAFRDGMQRAKDLRNDKSIPPGHEELNKWLANRFSQQ